MRVKRINAYRKYTVCHKLSTIEILALSLYTHVPSLSFIWCCIYLWLSHMAVNHTNLINMTISSYDIWAEKGHRLYVVQLPYKKNCRNHLAQLLLDFVFFEILMTFLSQGETGLIRSFQRHRPVRVAKTSLGPNKLSFLQLTICITGK